MNPYKIAEKVNSVLFGTFNLVSLAVFNTTKYLTGKNSVLVRNNELREIEEDTCIICGNGPSLGDFDFKSVEGIPIFTVNYFFNGDIPLEDGPSYHVVIDDAFAKRSAKDKGLDYVINAYMNHPTTKFIFRYDMLKEIRAIDPSLSHAYFVNYKYIQYNNRLRYDMGGMMTACHNVVLMALQCAMFMGYTKIYLIGCENNFFSNYTHFYDSSESNFKPASWEGLNYVDMAFKHYGVIRRHADKMGVTIINITPNSFINSFLEMPLDEFYLLQKDRKNR